MADDQGAGLGLQVARRITRSVSREAASNRNTRNKQPATLATTTEAAHSTSTLSASDPQFSSSSSSSPESDYAAIRESVLNESLYSRAAGVYRYLNRDVYQREAEEQQEIKQQQLRQEAAEIEEKRPKFFQLLLHDRQNRSTLYTLFLVSTIMIALPLSVFYLCNSLIFSSLSDNYRLSLSGLAAVVMVNIISIGFGLYAYYEPEDAESEEEKNERQEAEKARQDAWVRHVTKGQMIGVGKWSQEAQIQRDKQTEEEKKKDR